MKIIWSPRSKNQLAEFAEYIANDKPNAAQKWLEKIFSEVEKLENLPMSGRKVPELKQDNYRELLIGNYRIIYKLEKDKIFILSVRHSKQLLDKNDF